MDAMAADDFLFFQILAPQLELLFLPLLGRVTDDVTNLQAWWRSVSSLWPIDLSSHPLSVSELSTLWATDGMHPVGACGPRLRCEKAEDYFFSYLNDAPHPRRPAYNPLCHVVESATQFHARHVSFAAILGTALALWGSRLRRSASCTRRDLFVACNVTSSFDITNIKI